MSLSSFSVRRPVLTTVIYAVLILFGGVAYYLIPVDIYPDIEYPVISVITTYSGAGAEDVEERITKRIEETLGSVNNLDEMTGTSSEGVSVVSLSFDFGSDLSEASNDIRQSLDLVKRYLPEDADDPIVFKLDVSMMPIVMFGVTSKTGNVQQERDFIDDYLAERVRRVPGVGSVILFGAPETEVHVEVDRDKLAKHHLTISDVAGAIEAENYAIPGGSIVEGVSDITVRLPAEFQNFEEMDNMIIAARNGGVIRLSDVGVVRRDLAELKGSSNVDGRKALIMGVMKQSGANTVEVAKAAKAEVEAFSKTMPEHLEVITYVDNSIYITQMMNNMMSTLGMSVLLVIIVVWIFLRRWRPSLIVAVALPASTILAFFAMYLMDYTMNMISMMAMTVAIGMLVDNAIVVLENITRHMDEFGHDNRFAAIEGAREVGGAIFGSTLTTVAVFGPLVFVSGLISILFNQLALVVTLTIGASLLVALTLTPMMCSKWMHATKSKKSDRWFDVIDLAYSKAIGWSLNHRAIVVGVAVAVFGGTIYLTSLTGFDFLPASDSGQIQATVELPIGTALPETLKVAEELVTVLEEQPEVKHFGYRAGLSGNGMAAAFGGSQGTHIVRFSIMLKPLAERTRSDTEVAEVLRQKAKTLPEIQRFDVTVGDASSRMASGGGKPVSYEVRGNDLKVMTEVALQIKDIMVNTDGLKDVTADLPQMIPELRFVLDRDKAARLQVPAAVAAAGLRYALTGTTVGSYRGGSDDIDILVRYAPENRKDVEDLKKIQVRSLSGQLVNMEDLGHFDDQQTPLQIKRKDKQRVISVGGNKEGRAVGDIAKDVEASIKSAGLYGRRDVTIIAAGDVKQQRETAQSLGIAMLLGIILVYLVMAAQFESFLDPFVILFSIPFAFTGAFLALVITGTTISVPALLGLIILIGVVVNNAIVLVDYVNLLRTEQGMKRREALILTGRRRLRPILMTTLTTIFGLLPMVFTSGEGATFWSPLGLSTLGGLTLSTLVTLILIPVLYDLTEWARVRKFPGEHPQPPAVLPADPTAAAD